MVVYNLGQEWNPDERNMKLETMMKKAYEFYVKLIEQVPFISFYLVYSYSRVCEEKNVFLPISFLSIHAVEL